MHACMQFHQVGPYYARRAWCVGGDRGRALEKKGSRALLSGAFAVPVFALVLYPFTPARVVRLTEMKTEHTELYSVSGPENRFFL